MPVRKPSPVGSLTLTGTVLSIRVPLPSWPDPLLPQPQTLPSRSSARLNPAPLLWLWPPWEEEEEGGRGCPL
jgi:hypothetical protein